MNLLEILLALIITSILGLCTYPLYSNYLLKNHRLEAWASLAEDALLLEQCYAKTASYRNCPNLHFPHHSAQGYYRISLKALTEASYTLSARAIAAQKYDLTCYTFFLNERNQKTAENSLGGLEFGC